MLSDTTSPYFIKMFDKFCRRVDEQYQVYGQPMHDESFAEATKCGAKAKAALIMTTRNIFILQRCYHRDVFIGKVCGKLQMIAVWHEQRGNTSSLAGQYKCTHTDDLWGLMIGRRHRVDR